MTGELKAFVNMVMPNFLSPYRATRRYSRTGEFDKEIPLTTESGMENYFSKHVGIAERVGNLILLKKDTAQFRKDLVAVINKNENAQNGVFFLVKQEIERLHAEKNQIISLLSDKRLKDSLPREVHEHILSSVQEAWKKVFAEISKDMMWMADLELDVTRHSTRVRDFKIQLDFNLKSSLGHFSSRIQDSERDEKKMFKELLDSIIKHKDIKALDNETKQHLDRFISVLIERMKLIMEELKNLIIIVRDIEDALMSVYNKHVQTKLVGEMKLPSQTAEELKKEFAVILAVIKQKAQLYFQEAKYVAQKAA